MSTRSAIVMKGENGKYKGIYCHWDGYPSHNGKILYEHYQDPEKVKALIALSDLSSLAENVAPAEGQKHSYDERVDGVVVAYHRDRGEEMREVEEDEDINKILRKIEFSYVYLFEDGDWYIVKDNNLKAHPLKDILEMEDPDEFY